MLHRSTGVILALILAASGCLQPDGPPARLAGNEGEGRSTSPSEQSKADTKREPVVGIPDPASQGEPQTEFGFDAGDLDFDSAFHVFRIQAVEDDTRVNFTLDGALPSYAMEDDCFAFAILGPPEDPSNETQGPSGIAGVVSSFRNDGGYVRVRGFGADYQTSVFQTFFGRSDGPADVGVRGSGFVNLSAGEEIVVQLGARSNAMLHPANPLSGGHHFDVNLTASKPSRLGAFESARLRCGSGMYQVEESETAVHTWGPTVTRGGHVKLQTTNASTLLFETMPSDTPRDADVVFLGETHRVNEDPANIHLSAAQGGEVGFELGTWTEILPQWTSWFLADVWWPMEATAT